VTHDTCPLCRKKYHLVRVPSFDDPSPQMISEEVARREGRGDGSGPRRHAPHQDRDRWPQASEPTRKQGDQLQFNLIVP
jgi:hypothetical protein